MKISVQQYTRSLYDSVAGKSEKEVKAALKNFVALLGRNRILNKTPEIIAAFQEIWDKERGELAARIISARKLEPTASEIVVDYLRHKTSAKKVNLKEEMNKELLGGFVLRYGSKIVDGSLKNSLEELKSKISN